MRWQPKTLFYGIVLAAIAAISGIALLMLSGWFITATAITGAAIAIGLMLQLDIYLPGSGIRFFALSRTVGRYAERLYNHNAVLSLIASIRQQLFAGLMQLPNRQSRATQNNEWLSKLTADLDSLDTILLNMLIPPTVAVLAILLVGGFLVFFWPLLALLFTFSLLITCCFSMLLTIKTSQTASYQSAQHLNHGRSQAIEHLEGQLVLRSMAANRTHQQQLITTIKQFGIIQTRLNRRIQNCQLAHSILLGVCLIMITAMAFWGFEQNIFSGPMAILIILACIGLIELLQTLPIQLSQWGKTAYAAERLQPMAQSRVVKTQQNTTLYGAKSYFQQLQLNLARHPFIPASFDQAIELTLRTNDKLLVLGKSGRGKSSLSDLLCGLQDSEHLAQTQCEISINGHTLLAHNLADWQQQLGYLTQQNTILADTIYANLSLGMENLSTEQIYTALDMVELTDWVKSLPDGLDTWLGDTGNKLSGGQARRLCLARVILKAPQVIVLDEPFNGVDKQMASNIWTKLQPWLQDKCLVLLMHERPSFWGMTKDSNPKGNSSLTL